MQTLRSGLLSFLISFGIIACQPEIPDVEINATSENLSRKNGLQYLDNKLFSGYLVKPNPDGSVGSKQGFLNGKTEGGAVRYYENGQIREVRYFSNNQKTGTHKGYFPNGNRMFEFHFKNDLPVGIHKEFYESGELYAISTFNDEGQPEGLQQQFFKSGKVKANYTLKNGRRYGLMGSKGCMGENEKAATSYAENL